MGFIRTERVGHREKDTKRENQGEVEWLISLADVTGGVQADELRRRRSPHDGGGCTGTRRGGILEVTASQERIW